MYSFSVLPVYYILGNIPETENDRLISSFGSLLKVVPSLSWTVQNVLMRPMIYLLSEIFNRTPSSSCIHPAGQSSGNVPLYYPRVCSYRCHSTTFDQPKTYIKFPSGLSTPYTFFLTSVPNILLKSESLFPTSTVTASTFSDVLLDQTSFYFRVKIGPIQTSRGDSRV